MFIDDLMLLSGHDIPFPEAELMIHPLTPDDIAYITEKNYFLGIDLLNFSKDKLTEVDRSRLESKSDFEVLMSIMMGAVHQPDTDIQERVEAAMLVLTILFPGWTPEIQPAGIILTKPNEMPKSLNMMNYDAFKAIIQEICLLNKQTGQQVSYNPSGPKARALAEKFKKRREKLNNGKAEKISIYSRYASILAVALHLPLDTVMHYTLYQIDDQLERYNLNDAWQHYFAAKMAGATGMDEAENWMKDIHS